MAGDALTQALFDTLERFARTNIPLTLFGERGVGKSLLARAVHERSPRRAQPYVPFDCGSVSGSLVADNHLGHLPSAPSEAESRLAKSLVEADGGTLFLDNVDKLPRAFQSRLRRAIAANSDHWEGRPGRTTGVRLIASSCRDLRGEVAAGRFRRDLYFRLAAAPIWVPSLRQRRGDLPVLVQALLSELGRPDITPAESALSAICGCAWPGNADELKGELRHAMTLMGPACTVLESRHLRIGSESTVCTSADSLQAGPGLCGTSHVSPSGKR